MGRLFLATSLIAGLLGSPAIQRDFTGAPPPEVSRWFAAANQHEPGAPDEAAVEAGRWSHEVIWEIVIPRIERDTSRTWDNALLKRGAMLHTDIAVLDLAASDLRGLNTIARDRDSLGQGMGRTNPHLDVARYLLGRIQPPRFSDPDVAQWYHAVAAWLARRSFLGDLTYHLDARRGRFRDQPWFLFDDGCLGESMTSPRVEVITGSFRHTEFLKSAERSFRRAVELSPGMTEARVRHGRVLDLLGQHRESAAELRAALASIEDSELRYYALLFLGRAEEMAGSAENAHEAFEAAARLFPLAPSPVVALSRLAVEGGDRRTAAMLAGRVLHGSGSATLEDDPWWTYDQCAGRNDARLMEELRSRMRRLTP